MHHVHRQIAAVGEGWRSFVVAQKVENLDVFPAPLLEVVPRSFWRFVARARERHGSGAPWQISAGEAARIRAILTRHRTRVLHVFFGNVAVHLLPLLETVDVPVVVSFHGADVTGAIATPAYADARRRMFAAASAVACRSSALVDAVRELGCPPGKLSVLPTVLPDLTFHSRELPADGSYRLVQASRLIPKKGIATSLRAFARLVPEFPKMTFVIAGSGPMEAELRGLATQLGIAGRVHFAGFLGQAALRDLYGSAHVFLHPSETVAGDTEGVPNSLLEAMATGLPVVTTRHGGIPEVITHGETGMLCEEGNVEEVAGAVRELITNPESYARIAAGGAERVRGKFSRDAVSAAMARLYASVSGS